MAKRITLRINWILTLKRQLREPLSANLEGCSFSRARPEAARERWPARVGWRCDVWSGGETGSKGAGDQYFPPGGRLSGERKYVEEALSVFVRFVIAGTC